MSLMEDAKKRVTGVIASVASDEGVDPERLRRSVAAGRTVIPYNPLHSPNPIGVGEGLRVKVNANIGTSPDMADTDEEMKKLAAAHEAGADAIMDLSIGGDIRAMRRRLIGATKLPFGTVPVYQAGIRAAAEKGAVVDMTSDDMFQAVEDHAKDGVDFAVTHCGITKETVEHLKRQDRLIDMVSRGGSYHAAWIVQHGEENPLYKDFDHLLDIAKEYELTLSLGDGLRSGALHDANDRAKFSELIVLGELVERARAAGVQTMVEGPGHVPLNDIESNVRVMKKMTRNAPYYVLGPLVTDVAPGYDHIVGAIGGALAGWVGVDFLCYVTPSEHLCLPSPEDVREGVIVTRIAAHAADLARGREQSWERDNAMSAARRDLDWEKMFSLVIDPVKPRAYREKNPPSHEEYCTMCGEMCAIGLIRKYLRGKEP